MDINYLAYRLKYRYGQHLPLRTPVDVSLELSSQCNMKCSYCYHADENNLPFHKGIMKFETAEKILLEAAECGVNSLKYNWKGESTVNPDFKKITDLGKALASGSTFIDRLSNSNFKFATKREDIFEGFANQTKVKVSFDSFIPEVFEAQRTGGNHHITLRNIDKFYNHPARIKSETKLVIQAVRTSKNKDEDILGKAKERWREAEVSIRDMVAGRVEKNLDEFEERKRDASERQPCKQAFVRLIFNWDGIASPCCPDIKEELNLGDIKTTHLKKIFNSYMAKSLRKSLKNGSAFAMNPCLTCSSFESYKGYRANFDS